MYPSAINRIADIDSSKIEDAFQENQKQTLTFKTENEEYELDLEGMIQTNKRTGKKRAVKRRPGLTTQAL